MGNKKIIIIDPYGNVMTGSSLTETETHDDIIYRMFKDFLDSLTKEERDEVAKLLPTAHFEDSFLKNIFLVSYYLDTMIITENLEWLAVFLPRKISQIQEEYYLSQYAQNYPYQSCYYFDKDKNFQVGEINDFLHPKESIERIKKQISKICQETESQKTRKA